MFAFNLYKNFRLRYGILVYQLFYYLFLFVFHVITNILPKSFFTLLILVTFLKKIPSFLVY